MNHPAASGRSIIFPKLYSEITTAVFGKTEAALALINAGANVNFKNNDGSTALESVSAPFEAVKGIYDYFATTLEPLGLKLDYEQVKNTRSEIEEMLK